MTSTIRGLLTCLAISLGCLCDFGCGTDWMEPASLPIEGMVHKGPFAQGSRIHVLGFTDLTRPPSTVTEVRTATDLGDFRTAAKTPLVLLLAEGLYFNELTDQISDRPLDLQALAALEKDSPRTVNINLITHVTVPRARALQAGGMSLASAQAQAEDELRVALSLAWPTGTPLRGRDLSLVSPDPDQRAYLWAATLRYLRVAQTAGAQAGANSTGYMQSLMDQTSQGLASTGHFNTAEATQFAAARGAGVPSALIATLRAKLAALGSPVDEPDLARALDSDADGVADARDNCPRIANPEQGTRPLGICDVHVQEQALAATSASTFDWIATDGVDANGRGRVQVFSRWSAGNWLTSADAQGSFAPFQALTLPMGGPDLKGPSAKAQAIPDVDGDGASDVLVSTFTGSVQEGIYGTAGGMGLASFVPTTALPLPVLGGSTFRGMAAQGITAVVADFDRNGWMDLAGVHVDNANSYRIALQLQSAAGTWATPVLIAPIGSTQIRTLVTGDMNGDGNPDLIAAGLFGAQVWLGDGTGKFAPQSITKACSGSSGLICPASAVLADFDHNGTQDVLVLASNWQNTSETRFLGLLRGNGLGQLAPLETLATYKPSARSLGLRALDANGDGWVDILSHEGDELQLHMNSGNRLTAAQSLPTDLPASLLLNSLFGVRDLNRDGVDDLLFMAAAPPASGSGPYTIKLVRALLR